ncbi:hypothetical protein [Lacticaseibacillus saniviri]
MKFVLENKYLAPAINFLQAMKLKGTDSLARSKMVKLINAKYEELLADQNLLLNEYGARLDNSKPVTDSNPLEQDEKGAITIQHDKISEFKTAHTALLNQKTEISGGTYVTHISDVVEIIDNYAFDHELEGNDAEVYLELHEALTNETEGK